MYWYRFDSLKWISQRIMVTRQLHAIMWGVVLSDRLVEMSKLLSSGCQHVQLLWSHSSLSSGKQSARQMFNLQSDIRGVLLALLQSSFQLDDLLQQQLCLLRSCALIFTGNPGSVLQLADPQGSSLCCGLHGRTTWFERIYLDGSFVI